MIKNRKSPVLKTKMQTEQVSQQSCILAYKQRVRMGLITNILTRALLSSLTLTLLFGKAIRPFPRSVSFAYWHTATATRSAQLSATNSIDEDATIGDNSNDGKSSFFTFYEADASTNNGDIVAVNNRRHTLFMRMALKEANLASDENEVPIGAVVVQQINSTTYRILSQQHNRVEQQHDASAHAEMLALRDAAKYIKNWRLSSKQRRLTNNDAREANKGISQRNDDFTMDNNIWLYCTMEPCVMCLSAIQLFRVNHIVYGTTDHRLGAIESFVKLLGNNDTIHPFHTITSYQTISNVAMQEECSMIVKKNFRDKRQQNKIRNNVPNRLHHLPDQYKLLDTNLSRNNAIDESISRFSNYTYPDVEDDDNISNYVTDNNVF